MQVYINVAMSKPHEKSKESSQDVNSIVTELSDKDVTALRTHAQHLQTFHHRNKNQHRRSPWWRHFDHFRRDTKAFVIEVEGAQAAVTKDQPNVLSQKSKSKGKNEKLSIAERMQALKVERERLEARRAKCMAQMQRRKIAWSQALIATWYRSFSQLTTDPQFAVMGLFLIAALSKVCGILDIMPTVNEPDSESPLVPGDKGFKMVNPPDNQDFRSDPEVDVNVNDPELDVGVRIERAPSEDEDMAEEALDESRNQKSLTDERAKSRIEGSPPERTTSTSAAGKSNASSLAVPVAQPKTQQTPKLSTGLKRKDGPVKSKGSSKKSKKSGNAIDDLFSGLF